MENKARVYLRNNRLVIAVLLVIFIGIFLRAYHFSDWMHFELDQSRDANLVSNAIDRGAGDLPLLGPKARGTLLRLGPIFYYFMFISAKIFGNTPPAMALPVLIFSALSMPVFYLLMRRYFDRIMSFGLLSVFACSLFLIMYARFAWNPNALPFFLLAFFYALLRAVDIREKKRGWWLVAAFGAASVATQLHFLAYILVPAMSVIFLLFRRPRIALRFWTAAILMALIFYVPVMINELKSRGENSLQLLETIADRADGGQTSVGKKAAIAAIESARYYFLVVSGKDDSDYLNINPVKKTNQYCGESCLQLYPLGLCGLALLLGGLALIFIRLKEEQDAPRKDFLWLSAFWFFLTTLIFVPLATDLSPRFFLLPLPLPFVLLGLTLDRLRKVKIMGAALIPGALLALLIIFNLHETWQRFSELARAPRETFSINADRILKEKNRVTFEQEKLIMKYMLDIHSQNGQPVFYMSTAEYRPAFEYLLKRSGIQYDEISKDKVYREGNFFLILPAAAPELWDLRMYQDKYVISEPVSFGTLAVLELKPIAAAITADAKDFSPVPQKETRSKAPRYKWNQIFSDSGNGPEDDEE